MIGSIAVQVCYEDQQEELPLLVVQGTSASLLGRNWLHKIDPSGLAGDTPATVVTCTSGSLKEVYRGI